MPTLPRPFIEAYVETVAQAAAAERAGADRLELCGPGEGGLTPSDATVAAVVQGTGVPVHAMLRPRAGDFTYDADEFAQMLRDIPRLRACGATGVVFGVLQLDRRLDVERMRALVTAAEGLRTVCHRAFDLTPDPDEALEQLVTLGIHEVLTSGQAADASAGVPVLRRLHARADGRIDVLIGGGVRAHNVARIIAQTGVPRVHARAVDAGVIAEMRAAVQRLR